jgi:hypothetical protein
MIHYIGVDPAFRMAGFYICQITNFDVEFIRIDQFIDFIAYIDNLSDTGIECYICIENSNLTNTTFIGRGVKNMSHRESISRKVGKNQAISQMAVDYSKYRLKYGVYSVSPAEKGTKWEPEIMDRVMKSQNHSAKNFKNNKSDQDKRDAYKLACMAQTYYLREFRK